MDEFSPLLAIVALSLAGVTWHAWRLGNERRDVALLAAFAMAGGVASAAAAL
ncbi:MAG TPA: hypothetical protein VEZ89_09010 [Rubrivivax sp.]|nr:hypothetical protein [Rubrivivax sp.]